VTDKHLNCTYGENGCRWPGGCATCGFDAAEAARRRAIPLTLGPDGLWRKYVGREREDTDERGEEQA
jgi:hypothetical protein